MKEMKFDENNHFGDVVTWEEVDDLFEYGAPAWITGITKEGLTVMLDDPIEGDIEIEITPKDVNDYFMTNHGMATMHNIKGVYMDHRPARNFMEEMGQILGELINKHTEE
jgi:hypothetical protein